MVAVQVLERNLGAHLHVAEEPHGRALKNLG